MWEDPRPARAVDRHQIAEAVARLEESWAAKMRRGCSVALGDRAAVKNWHLLPNALTAAPILGFFFSKHVPYSIKK